MWVPLPLFEGRQHWQCSASQFGFGEHTWLTLGDRLASHLPAPEEQDAQVNIHFSWSY